MKGKRRTGAIVLLTIAVVLMVVPALSGCGSRIGQRISNVVKAAVDPGPTATDRPPTAQPETPESSPTPASVAVVTVGALTLRGGPGTTYAALGTLRKGDRLTITGSTTSGDWLAVTTGSGKKGWVAAAYVAPNALPQEIPTATELPPPAATPATEIAPPAATPAPTLKATLTPFIAPTRAPDAVVAADPLTLRTGPGTAYARVGTLRKGDTLTLTARTSAGDWLAVTTEGGKSGWVASTFVQLNLPVEEIPVATGLPSTPLPPPTQPPSRPLPTEGLPTPAPTSGLSVDDQIANINRGQHDQLPQPPMVGSVAAGGEAELTILNDTPYDLTVMIGSPNQTTITVEKCPTCSTYGVVGPLFCQEEGRPRQTLRVKPGTMKVAARVDNPTVIPFSGEWVLSPDNAYFNCFFLVTR
jgi:uncharacterized protein YraI